MFHFPTFPPHALCVQAWVTGHDSCRVSPFGNPRITARLAAPRGLSQPPTSFIGSWCQGIHRAPLITWPQRCSRPLCSSQGTDRPNRNPPQTPTHTSTPTRHQNKEGRSVNGWSNHAHTATPLPKKRGRQCKRSPKKHPLPQDPTACLRSPTPPTIRSHQPPRRTTSCTYMATTPETELVSVPPMSTRPEHSSDNWAWTPRRTAMPDAP